MNIRAVCHACLKQEEIGGRQNIGIPACRFSCVLDEGFNGKTGLFARTNVHKAPSSRFWSAAPEPFPAACKTSSALPQSRGWFLSGCDGRTAGGIRLFGFVKQLATDQHAADFAGTGADFVQFRIAPQAAQRVFVGIAVAAENLNAFAGHPSGFFRTP